MPRGATTHSGLIVRFWAFWGWPRPGHGDTIGALEAGVSDATTRSFLFTDIEGSTRLVAELADAYGPVLDSHHRLARQAIAARGGTEVSTKGDSFFVLFNEPLDAVLAATDFQRALAAHAWPAGVQVHVRMGIHSGRAILAGGEYVGIDLNRASRITDAANGGQVLLSDAARKAVAERLPADLTLVDVGRHRLKDVGTEHIWRLRIDGLRDDPRPPRSIETAPTNLPVEPTRLVDRAAEGNDLQALVTSVRVVTITGPGGVGKSRVAVRVARETAPAFPDGVFYLDLALVNDLDLALQQMAEVLGLRPSLAASPLDQVIDDLRPRRLLVLLDTADRVPGLGAALGAITAATPLTCFLVTSRSPLRIAAEHEYPLGPLAARDPGAAEPRPAVALFLERARAARPGLEVADVDLETIAAICDRVDRLPLAIELAAARMRTLTPAAILARLTRLLPVLTGGVADAPARQRTLRDTIAWSYGLLDAADQDVLQRIAVFASSFDLDAVEAIAGPHLDVLDALERLVDRSLLTAAPTAEPRFRLLGAIRELAVEMLDASASAVAVREAHARYWLDAVGRWTAAIGSAEEAAALAALEQAQDDTRAALAWALLEPVEPNRAGLAVALAARLGRFWWIRGRLREGSAWLERALAHADGAAPDVRAAALGWAGVLLDDLGDPAGADRRLEAALAIQQSAGDEAGAAGTLNSLGVVAYSLGDLDRAEQLLRREPGVEDAAWPRSGPRNHVEQPGGRGGCPAATTRRPSRSTRRRSSTTHGSVPTELSRSPGRAWGPCTSGRGTTGRGWPSSTRRFLTSPSSVRLTRWQTPSTRSARPPCTRTGPGGPPGCCSPRGSCARANLSRSARPRPSGRRGSSRTS